MICATCLLSTTDFSESFDFFDFFDFVEFWGGPRPNVGPGPGPSVWRWWPEAQIPGPVGRECPCSALRISELAGFRDRRRH